MRLWGLRTWELEGRACQWETQNDMRGPSDLAPGRREAQVSLEGSARGEGAFERLFRLLRLRASEGFYIEQDKAQAILLSDTHSAS